VCVVQLVTNDGLVHVREHSVCDLDNKKLTLISRNVRLAEDGDCLQLPYCSSFSTGLLVQPVHDDRETGV